MNTNNVASWSNTPKPWNLLSIKNAITHFSMVLQGTLLDGALISYMRRPLPILKLTKSSTWNAQFQLVLEPRGDERIMAYNPGMNRISRFLPNIFEGHDIALARNSGYSVMDFPEMEQEWLIRLVSYQEALRYFAIPEPQKIVDAWRSQWWELQTLLNEEVYQVTAKWSEKVRIIMQTTNYFPQFPFPGGGGSLKKRKPVHA